MHKTRLCLILPALTTAIVALTFVLQGDKAEQGSTGNAGYQKHHQTENEMEMFLKLAFRKAIYFAHYRSFQTKLLYLHYIIQLLKKCCSV